MNIGKIQTGADAIFSQENRTEQKSDITQENISPLQEAALEDRVSVSGIWRKVANDIDVRAATPREIMDLSHQLYNADAISYDDYINLSFQPEVNPDSAAQSKPFSHEPKNYIELWQSKQENVIRTGGDRSQIEDTHRIQAILAYVDSLK